MLVQVNCTQKWCNIGQLTTPENNITYITYHNETSVTVNNNSPIQDYVHPDDQTQPTFHNVLVCHPKILHKHCFQFLLGVKMAPRETENNAYAKRAIASQ